MIRRVAAPFEPALPAPVAQAEASSAVRLLLMLCICGLVAMIYWQSGHFEFLEWDDGGYVRGNPNVFKGLSAQSFSWALTSFYMANWHPVTWWSYQIDVSLFGPSPGAMHLENMVLHAINSLLVYSLFVRYKIRPLPALLAAAVFAVHPLHVESVVWISQRKDLLSTIFLLALLLVWDRYVRRGGSLRYCMVLVLAALGMMAKPMLVTLPFLLLMLDAWPYARLRSGSQPWFRDRQLLARYVEKIPFFIFAAICAGLTVIAQSEGGALTPIDEAGILYRLGNTIVSYAAYAALTIVPPFEQSFIYIYPLPGLIWVGTALLVLALVSWWAAKQGGAVLVGWLWFLVTLLPVIGLVKVGLHSRADRYMYVPMIGMLLMLASTISSNRIVVRLGCKGRRVLWAAACSVVLMQTWAAYRYASNWRNSETLFTHALEVDSENYVAHMMLAIHYGNYGKAEQCLLHADKVLQLMPRSPAAAVTSLSASNAAISLGNPALGRQYLDYAIAIFPKYAKAYYYLGALELEAENLDAAIRQFRLAIALEPQYSEAHNNLGVALLRSGRKEEAFAAFSDAIRHGPSNPAARQNLERMAW
jgi:tetratricopeptide (TPR) repeat protein